LERWKSFAWFNLVCTLLFASWVVWKISKSEDSVRGEVRVHRIVVIDDADKERIVIAAPLKDLPRRKQAPSWRVSSDTVAKRLTVLNGAPTSA
jgi:hypothetical protein